MAEIQLRALAAIEGLIRDRRRGLGIDQAEMDAQIGVSRVWVNQVARGKQGASLGLILSANLQRRSPRTSMPS